MGSNHEIKGEIIPSWNEVKEDEESHDGNLLFNWNLLACIRKTTVLFKQTIVRHSAADVLVLHLVMVSCFQKKVPVLVQFLFRPEYLEGDAYLRRPYSIHSMEGKYDIPA